MKLPKPVTIESATATKSPAQGGASPLRNSRKTIVRVAIALAVVVVVGAVAVPEFVRRARAREAAAKAEAERALFKDVHRAARSITAATEVGVNRIQLSGLVRELRTEVALLRDASLSSDGEKTLGKYEKVSELYADSLVAMAWPLRDIYGDKVRVLPEGDSQARLLCTKYGFKVEYIWGHLGVSGQPVQVLWLKARAALEGKSEFAAAVEAMRGERR